MSWQIIASSLVSSLLTVFVFFFNREITERWPNNAAMRTSAFNWASRIPIWLGVFGPIALGALIWYAPDPLQKTTVLLMCLGVTTMCFGVMLASVHALTRRLADVEANVYELAKATQKVLTLAPTAQRTAAKAD